MIYTKHFERKHEEKNAKRLDGFRVTKQKKVDGVHGKLIDLSIVTKLGKVKNDCFLMPFDAITLNPNEKLDCDSTFTKIDNEFAFTKRYERYSNWLFNQSFRKNRTFYNKNLKSGRYFSSTPTSEKKYHKKFRS